jgi:hypothetical protein
MLDSMIATDMSWNDRIDNYRRVIPWPASLAIGEDGRLFGMWEMGNDYRVKTGYYGGYPPTYLRRVKALFPEKRRVLHIFSGRVDLYAFPGDAVDINPDMSPTFLDDCQRMDNVPLQDYDLVLADPPYSVEDCEHYGTTMVKRNLVMKALSRLSPGAHVVWLDQVKPMYRKDTFSLDGQIGMSKSTNHRYRHVAIFRRIQQP